ncbi:MAG: anti-sigma factor [Silvibacterium sp.]|nr:anti-sigma factor [Silvibacterium sp.]
MDCDQNTGALGAYLDNELPRNETTAVSEHIASCPKCAAEIAELVRIKRGLRPAQGHFAPSSGLRRSVEQLARQQNRRASRLQLVSVAVFSAAILLIVIASAQFLRRPDHFVEIADLHINALASANPVDVVSSDRHAVKPWFQGKIPFSFNLPEFSGTEFTLLGGRVVYFHQSPCAQLMVALSQHKISVLILQDTTELDRAFAMPATVSHRSNFSVDTWQSQGLRFFVIGDADPSAIGRLSQAFQSANK